MLKKIRLCIAILVGVILLYPIFFVFFGSLMGNEEVREYLLPIMTNTNRYSKFFLLPSWYTLQFYVELLLDTPDFYIMFWNSVKVSVFIIIGQLIVSTPAAWSFARYEFAGKKVLFQLYILLMVLPFVVMMLPQYLVLKRLQLLDSLWAIILPGIFSTFPVFLTQYYFRKIPASVIETAKLDGADEWKIFYKIGIPLAKPAIFTSVILNFIDYWGTMEQLTVFIESRRYWTLPILITSIKLDNAGITFVASVFSVIPPVLLILYGKEDLEEGLASVSLKG